MLLKFFHLQLEAAQFISEQSKTVLGAIPHTPHTPHTPSSAVIPQPLPPVETPDNGDLTWQDILDGMDMVFGPDS